MCDAQLVKRNGKCQYGGENKQGGNGVQYFAFYLRRCGEPGLNLPGGPFAAH